MVHLVAKRWLAVAILPICLLSYVAVAQESKEDAKPARSAGKEKKKGKAAAGGRLPNGWTQLGLSEEQKKKIYAAQQQVRPKIEQLQKQIDDLEADLRVQLRAVLTDEQLKKLEVVEASAKKKASERRREKAAKPSDDKSEDAKSAN
jgi:Spy/CpxP family protein refolding chaperone